MTDAHAQFTRRDGPRDRSLRAADSDREAVAELLRQQHVAGRLDTDELQERIERCYAAKTYSDLDALVADLPGEQPRPSAARPRWPRPMVALLVLVVAAAAVLSHGHLIWLAIPAFFLVSRTLVWRGGGGRFAGRGFGCRARHSIYV
jgi:Domain of unknown function (DUF1707)